MLDDLIAEIVERGYGLHYLRGPSPTWEASLTRPLAQPRDDGYRFAVGFGCGSAPTAALEDALVSLETDFEFLEPPTCAHINVDHLPDTGSFDLMALITKSLNKPNPFKGQL